MHYKQRSKNENIRKILERIHTCTPGERGSGELLDMMVV